MNSLLLGVDGNSSVGSSVEVEFPATDAGLLDLNNFLFRIAVDHSSETLLEELFRSHGDVSGMGVYHSLERMAARVDLLPAAFQAFRACLPIGSASAAFTTSSISSSDVSRLHPECALLSLWPLIGSISIEVPPSHWTHLPPNLTVFDTPGTSMQMLQNAMAKRRQAATTNTGDNADSAGANPACLSSDDLAWLGSLDITHVWLVSLSESLGADMSVLQANLEMLASMSLLPSTDVIFTKLDTWDQHTQKDLLAAENKVKSKFKAAQEAVAAVMLERQATVHRRPRKPAESVRPGLIPQQHRSWFPPQH